MTHTGHCISIRSPTVRLGLPCMRTSSRVYHSGASPHCSEACLPGETSHRATAQSAQGRPQLPSAPSALQTVSLSHGLAMRARMLERRRRAAPRPAREPAVPRSASHAQERCQSRCALRQPLAEAPPRSAHERIDMNRSYYSTRGGGIEASITHREQL